jgi:hypothetical protein
MALLRHPTEPSQTMRFAAVALAIGIWTAGCSQEKTPYTVVDKTSNPPRISPALTNQPAPVVNTNATQTPNP